MIVNKINGTWYKWTYNRPGQGVCEGCAFYHKENNLPICDIVNNASITCADGIFIQMTLEERSETEILYEEMKCPFCEEDSRKLPIEIDSTANSNQELKIEDNTLQSDEWKLSINYCPMCGRKLK